MPMALGLSRSNRKTLWVNVFVCQLQTKLYFQSNFSRVEEVFWGFFTMQYKNKTFLYLHIKYTLLGNKKKLHSADNLCWVGFVVVNVAVRLPH